MFHLLSSVWLLRSLVGVKDDLILFLSVFCQDSLLSGGRGFVSRSCRVHLGSGRSWANRTQQRGTISLRALRGSFLLACSLSLAAILKTAITTVSWGCDRSLTCRQTITCIEKHWQGGREGGREGKKRRGKLFASPGWKCHIFVPQCCFEIVKNPKCLTESSLLHCFTGGNLPQHVLVITWG